MTARNRSTEAAFVGEQVNFNSRNSSAIQDLPPFYFRYHWRNRFSHVIWLQLLKQQLAKTINKLESNSLPACLVTGKEKKKMREIYYEENRIGSFGPDGGIDGVFDFTREHVLV